MTSGYVFGFLSLICSSFFGVLTKNLYSYDVNELIILFYIAVFSFLYFFSKSLLQNKFSLKNTFKASKHDILFAILNHGFLAIFVPCITSIISLKYIDTGIQRAIVYSSAIYIIIIEFLFLHRKFDLKTLFYSFGIIISLFLVIGNIKFNGNFNKNLMGIFLAFLSAITYAVYSIIAERNKLKIKDGTLWIYTYLFTILCSFICIVLKDEIGELNIFHNSKIIMEVILSAIICTGLSEDFLLKSIKSIGSVKANAIIALIPVTTLIIGNIFLNETITLWQFVGFVVLVISSIKIK